MTEITRSQVGVNTYLAPSGSLADTHSLNTLKTEVDQCITVGQTLIILDLNTVPTVSSAVLELLLDWREQLLPEGGSITLVNVNTVIAEVLKITGVGNFIPVINRSGIDSQSKREEITSERLRLGDMLIAEKLIEHETIDKALQLQSATGKRLGSILLEKGWVSETDLLKLLSKQLNIPYIHLRPGLWDPAISNLIDKETSQRLVVLPLFKIQSKLILATNDPQDLLVLDELKSRTGYSIKPVLAKKDDIIRQHGEALENDLDIAEYLGNLEEDFEVIENQIPDDYAVIDELSSESPVVNLINAMIQRAIRDGASDIHIEPGRNKSRIRFRLDGILYEVMNPAAEMHPALVSRLKVMANLDIAERRLPQDGRIQVNTQGRVVDLRFSSLPGIFGEKLVLRVLDKNQNLLNIDNLSMSESNRTTFTKLLKRTHGLILVTGPTGSGKTTTLYAALNYLNSIEKNIVTIEDPVEYQLDIINQNQVKDGIGLSFAKMLKHVLRQDPDIVMVGEIRERETAEIAVQAALTGHLVLSTLHTNESTGAISRLLEMGIEPYLLSSSLIGVVAQRLIRMICPDCKTTYIASPEEIEHYGWQQQGQVRLAKGRGCQICYDSGYKGRIASHEILATNAELQKLMVNNPSQDELNDYLNNSDTTTLYQDGLSRVLDGVTTLEEVSRVIAYE